jgi:adenylosuccinate lyase
MSNSAQLPNVLASRYASEPMRAIWSPQGRVLSERELWIAVMKAQQSLGVDIPQAAIDAYERVKNTIDLGAIAERERVTRHDVKARIEAFCELAGHEHLHKGMTSRDLTENVEQLQLYASLKLLRLKAVAALHQFAERARQWQSVPVTARTHNVAAQQTTMGKRMAMFGEDLLGALDRLDHLLQNYPARGLKGAVGTQLDPLSLLDNATEKVSALEAEVARFLGIPQSFKAVGQVYPRSLDHAAVNALFELASGPASFATTLRLMAGHELAGEGFAPGQVGSSAMPHKMNSRSCERICGFQTLLRGYLVMTSGLAGDQWNEGDVSCSVVRRIALPDACFALDGLFETLLTVLGQMELNEAVVERENAHYLPFLLTTTVLMEAVKAGAGREAAHEAIKEHAVATLRDLRSGKARENDLFERLGKDPRLNLSPAALDTILEKGATATGAAQAQVEAFCLKVDALVEAAPEAKTLTAGPIL